MRIAVDLDGTLYDPYPWVIEELKQKAGLRADFTMEDWTQYDLRRCGSAIDMDRYYEAFGPRMIRCCPLAPDARWFMARLHYQAEIVILTSRDPAHEGVTLARLLEDQIPYDHVVHTDNKTQWCHDHRIDYLIDDAVHHCGDETCRCILIDAPYNQGFQRPHVARARGLRHAYAVLMRDLHPDAPQAPDVTNKRDMYQLLNSGQMGNRTIGFDTIEEAQRYADQGNRVGIRTKRPGGPFLMVAPEELAARYRDLLAAGEEVNMTPIMPDDQATLQCYVRRSEHYWDLDIALAGGPLRFAMRESRHERGAVAQATLRRALCPGSYEDLMVLFDRWPDATVELTAYGCCIDHLSTVPNRNTVIWEVRHY